MAVVRFTKQRQAVLTAVQETTCHPDAAWVYAEVRKVLPNISLGTVYRSLDTLVQDGHLISIQGAGESTRYDVPHPDHYHVVCDGCGAIFDVYLGAITLPQMPAQHLPAGFQLSHTVLEFHGRCAQCATSTTLNQSE